MARAMATRCCWPPESSAGVWCSQPSSPTRASAGLGGGMAGGRLFAAIEQRQFDILQRRGARQQVEALKDEAQVVAAQQGALVAVEAFDMDAAKQVVAGSRRVEAAEDVHRGGFAGTARPHDGDEFALDESRDRRRSSAWNAAWPWP